MTASKLKISSKKFTNPKVTADNQPRAFVDLEELKMLWFNTGSRCNLECANCYIESSPTNNRYVHLTVDDVVPFLEEIRTNHNKVKAIGLTGGEPFVNPAIKDIITAILSYDLEVLILTNGYLAIKKYLDDLKNLSLLYPHKLKLRISLDHYTQEIHEIQRGGNTFNGTLKMLKCISDQAIDFSIAGRTLITESFSDSITGYQKLFNAWGIDFDLSSQVGSKLVLFPELTLNEDVPEITVDCWDILNKRPQDQMCASERMIVKKSNEANPVILPCTILVYEPQFEFGQTLKEAQKKVWLNHEYCAKFCVLGGASCSSTS